MMCHALTKSGTNRGVAVQEQTSYLIQRGDSYWAMAQRFLGNGRRFNEIIKANLNRFPILRIIPRALWPGWLILIPAA